MGIEGERELREGGIEAASMAEKEGMEPSQLLHANEVKSVQSLDTGTDRCQIGTYRASVFISDTTHDFKKIWKALI